MYYSDLPFISVVIVIVCKMGNIRCLSSDRKSPEYHDVHSLRVLLLGFAHAHFLLLKRTFKHQRVAKTRLVQQLDCQRASPATIAENLLHIIVYLQNSALEKRRLGRAKLALLVTCTCLRAAHGVIASNGCICQCVDTCWTLLWTPILM